VSLTKNKDRSPLLEEQISEVGEESSAKKDVTVKKVSLFIDLLCIL
jgi:hypothetical protein